ncbi:MULTISPECIES: hypothetical protein [unclassified Streptomyces]|uniref:hypothetical protein n=1 Tax=unclassified Streptomyces TaxID=2593676 RepID=UPI00382386B2
MRAPHLRVHTPASALAGPAGGPGSDARARQGAQERAPPRTSGIPGGDGDGFRRIGPGRPARPAGGINGGAVGLEADAAARVPEAPR